MCQGFFCLAITVFCGFLCGFLMAHVCLAFAVFFLQNWLRPSRSKVCKYLSLGASCQEVQTEASDSPYSRNTLPMFHVFNVFMLTLKLLKHMSSVSFRANDVRRIQMGSAVGVRAPGTQPSASSFSSGIIFRKLLKANHTKSHTKHHKTAKKSQLHSPVGHPRIPLPLDVYSQSHCLNIPISIDSPSQLNYINVISTP